MSLKSLDMQVLLPKSQEVGNRQQNERQAVPNTQHNLAAEAEIKRNVNRNKVGKNEETKGKKVRDKEESDTQKRSKKGKKDKKKRNENRNSIDVII